MMQTGTNTVAKTAVGPYDPEITGIVFNIQRFSVHDGPGIRTVVFLKGCSLRCLWCSNPESLARREQLGVFPDRCIGVKKCGACLSAAADADLITIEDDKVTGFASKNTRDIRACADACPAGALRAWGRRMSVADVMAEVRADRDFYEESGGGLTLSGGEALIQTRFAVELLKAARAEGINTCVETALNYSPDVLDSALPYIDLVYCDLKHMDAATHRRCTGVSNERILANAKMVVRSGTPVVIRIPVVPEHNGTEENLRATAEFIRDELGGRPMQVQLLPFRNLGREKYRSLGMTYPMADFEAPPRETWEPNLRSFAEIMAAYGLDIVGSSGASLTTR